MTMGAMSSLCFFIAGLGRAAGGPAADAGADKPVVYLDTGLSAGDRDHFFRDGLGNRTLPESWFRALEDPSGRTLLGDRQNLASVGFLYEPGKDLPIGLARNDGPGGPWLGVNCAHCHTTDLSYKGQTVRIVGGTSRFDTNQFYGKLFGAILRTSSDEAAFKSFADRLLGPAADAGARAQLKAAIGQTAAKVRPFVDSYAALHPVASGPRFAFYDIFLNVTAAPLDPRNARPERAYAGMRSLWGMSKLQWAHADGAFSSTVARIAFGFSAFDAFYSAASVDSVNWNVANVHRNAVKIANKVQPPAWPERSFGRLDRQRVRRGERIYRARCAGCHEPGPSEDSERFLAASMIPYKEIGTDPVYIESQYDKHPTTGQLTPRKVFTGALAATVFADREGRPRPVVDFATDYLPTVSRAVMDARYRKVGIDPAAALDSIEDGRRNVNRRPEFYTAKPLQGIWATAPYLHNDSVPSLYEMLLPASQRSKRFRIGGDFSPERVGYHPDAPVGFEMDTTIAGNGNQGHEGMRFGTPLEEAARLDLIEYLKTL